MASILTLLVLLSSLVLLLLPAGVTATPFNGVSIAKYRDQFRSSVLQKLRHGEAGAFRFGRFQSPSAVEEALDGCRKRSAFKQHRCKRDGRNGMVASTRLGGDWVLAESKQVAPSCTAAEVLGAYLDAENQKRWNADRVLDIRIRRTGPGRYRQDMVLKSQRIITSQTGVMRYTQTITVDQIGTSNFNAAVRLDPDAESNTARKPFDSLAVNVCLRQVGEDVHIYAAGIMRVNRGVVPNLVVFDASGIAGDMAGKGTLWLSSHFEERASRAGRRLHANASSE